MSAAMHDPPARDPVFATALDARSLIEASAGTGKTYALAGLFARAVIVSRLRVPQVLAVTYTVAATQELHERVRLRLQRAGELAAQWRDGDPAERDGDSPDAALLRRLLHQALNDEPRESLPALRLRLARAQRDLDLAAITTIHGFCQRVLAEHALATGQPLLAATLEPAARAQRQALAVDLWREFGRDRDGADFLRREFRTPEALADTLRALLAPEPLLPPAPQPLPADPRAAVQAAWDALCTSHAAHATQACADVSDALAGKVLSGNKYRAATLQALWQWLATHTASSELPNELHDKLDKLTAPALRDGCNAGRDALRPQSPLFDAIATLLAQHAQIACWREAGDLQRLHALRTAAWRRDRVRKLAFNLRDYDDLIGAVHAAVVDPATGPMLAAALRAQFPLALVDEFQDTDARQWTIFSTLFAEGGLVLVGDPKQAIYRFRGGDVHTYLAAKHTATPAPALERNFRSRPCVLAAVNALFQHAPADVLGAGIGFHATTPGGHVGDGDCLLDGAPMPALAFHRLPSPGDDSKGKPRDWTKPESIRLAARLCALAIRDILLQARAGRALRRDGDTMRALEPRDCAVLVRTHAEAMAVREQLARLGVPAVAAGRRSLFDSDEAVELLTLLLALAAPGDERRLRAALATRLLGLDAAALCTLEDDGDALRQWQQTFERWRARWEQHGPQPLFAQVVAQQAARRLAVVDGERRVTHLLQLGELLQEARAQRLGSQGQLDWLRARIAAADPDDENQQPRLESDAGRVQILTLHKSKGLEFPLVYLPFVGIGRKGSGKSAFAVYQHAGERVRQWKTDAEFAGAPSWDEASVLAEAEDRAEDMRLLYVGLTRAQDALWLCGGALAAGSNSALQRLLGGPAPASGVVAALAGALRVSDGLPRADDDARLPPLPGPAPPPAREARRRLHRDWWIHSFSQLHRQQSHGAQVLAEESPADDERPLAAVAELPRDLRFSGARFGNVLHHALEHVDFAAWRDHAAAAPPPAQAPLLIAALQSQDYAEPDFADGVRALVPLVARTLNAPLPCVGAGTATHAGVRLCDLPPTARIAELEFHFSLDGARSDALLGLLHAHGIASARRDFGAWTTLAGLMNGKIDLTYRVDGRIYVLDYKSNFLPDYDDATMAHAMAAHEYDLQALLYAVAVHRWQRLRRGADYDYARDFGGAVYVFCRGLDAGDPARGLVLPALPAALVEAVDVLLSAPRGGHA